MSVSSLDVAPNKSTSGLRAGVLTRMETIGQSMAAIAPTLTPALNISVVAGLAGVGCWLSYFIGTIGVVFVALCVGLLAVRHPEAGSFFVYVGRTLGPLSGALSGWSMVSAYTFTSVATALSFAIFLDNSLRVLGVGLSPSMMCIPMLGFVGLVTYAAYRDVKLSSRAGLILEVLSVGIIVAITIVVVHLRGSVVDAPALKLSSFKLGAVFSALPFVVFSFVGFESAATFAKESAHPRRNIPLAVIGCAAFAGIFFTLMAYFMVLAMDNDAATLGTSSAPFRDVAQKAGLSWAPAVVYFAAMISVFACCLASINAASRLLFSMGKYRFLHQSMGHVHETHQTPHRAILLCGTLTAIVSIAMMPLGLLDAFGCAGTFASFGFVVVYLALCIVAPMDLKRGGEMKLRHLAVGALGVALMLFVIVGSVYPVPVSPYNVLPYIFLAYMAVGTVWFIRLKARSPTILASIQHDMEGA
jgi:amino acid transporter